MKKIFKILDFYLYKRSISVQFKKIKEKNRVRIYKNIRLNKEQKKSIDDFYKKNLGKKIKYNWHREYYAISGKFDYKYFPELLYIPEYERIVNHRPYYEALQDKNITELLIKNFNDIKYPKIIFRSSNGLLTDSNYNLIQIGECLKLLNNEEYIFIKPTVDTGSGKGCKILNKIEIENLDIAKLLKEYNYNLRFKS